MTTHEPIQSAMAKAEHPWLGAARAYARTLANGAIAGVAPIAHQRVPEVCAVCLDSSGTDSRGLDQVLDETYCLLAPGDILLLDVPSGAAPGARTGEDRDAIGRALYRAGFDCPFMWAGRNLLLAEAKRPLLSRLLPSAALGAGPAQIPGVDTVLRPPRDRLIVMARRGALPPPRDRTLRLSVVMPVYNERKTFRDVIERLLAKRIPGVDIEICVVESNSTDGTREEVLRYADHSTVRVAFEDRPSGKGHAVRKGLELSTGDFVLIQDADLEYNLDDYEKLLEPLRGGQTSFVLGSRHPRSEKIWRIRQFSDQRGMAYLLNFGHLIFTWFFNVMFGQSLRDPFTMYKVFRRDCIHAIRFVCNRFDFDHELVGKLIRNGFHPIEIDIRYQSRSFREGKKISLFRDPPTWVRACVQQRFSRLHDWPGSV